MRLRRLGNVSTIFTSHSIDKAEHHDKNLTSPSLSANHGEPPHTQRDYSTTIDAVGALAMVGWSLTAHRDKARTQPSLWPETECAHATASMATTDLESTEDRNDVTSESYGNSDSQDIRASPMS